MALVNESKPTTSLTNSTKINIGETWDSILSTWATESRTWDDMASIIDNISKGTIGFLWSVSRFPWTESTPWLTEGGISNIAKP